MHPLGGGRGEELANVRIQLFRLHSLDDRIATPASNRIYVPCRAAQPVALVTEQLYSFPPDNAAPVTENERQTAVLEYRHGE